MNNRKMLFAVAAVLALAAAGGWGLYALGLQRGMERAPVAGAASPAAAVPQGIAEGEEATRRHIATGLQAGDTDPVAGRKILYYHDPMVPGNKFDKPAKSPFMDMMLVPVYAGGAGDSGGVTVSPRLQQNLGVRTAVVAEGSLANELAAVGSIAFNERDQAVVQARATGYVERLRVRATLDRVIAGQVLAELYVPDWVAAQEEFLAVRRMQGANLGPLVDGARVRMKLAGMSDAQIRRVETTGRTDARIAVTAPTTGLLTEIAVREGMTVAPGMTLFRISGFSTVWANAEVPESQAARVRPGARVRAQTPAVPGVAFDGRVQALLPDVNATTRTLKARVELANPRGQLVPGMFVSMQFTDAQARKAMLVPTEAVIHTGKRSVVVVAEEGGKFRPVQVQAGAESGGQTEIRSGLQPGQRVVVSSQFLIDSEASLKGVEGRMSEPSKPVAAAASPRHAGEARIEAVAPDALTLSHGPIPSIKWGPMTMDFKPPTGGALPGGLKAGDRIGFEFYMDPEGLPQLTRVTPLPAAAPGGDK